MPNQPSLRCQRHESLTTPWARLVVLFTLMLLLLQTSMSPPTSAATSSKRVTMLVSLLDESNSGRFIAGDQLHLIVVAFVNGSTEKNGTIRVSSTDPERRNVCTVQMSSKRFYCDFGLSNIGKWKITAQYRGPRTLAGTPTASKAIEVTIHPPSTPVTTPTAQETETLMGPGSSFYQVTSNGEYLVTVTALVSVIQFFSPELLSPGAGTIQFFDAAGNFICNAQIPLDSQATLISCSGGPFTSAPAEPLTAFYSGTSSGFNDGRGASYGSSSGSLTIGP